MAYPSPSICLTLGSWRGISFPFTSKAKGIVSFPKILLKYLTPFLPHFLTFPFTMSSKRGKIPPLPKLISIPLRLLFRN